jgi:hypothetical protein
LGEGGHDREHRPAHRPVGVQALGEAPKLNPARGELLDDGEDVLGGASEAIQLPYREDVTFPKMVQGGIELWTAGRRAAHPVAQKTRAAPASWSASS